MTFLIGIQTPGCGEYAKWELTVPDKKTAQNLVADLLVEAGIPRDKIGKQVTDKSTLHFGLHTVTITPLTKFDAKAATALAALF